jgi:hypothetical protein
LPDLGGLLGYFAVLSMASVWLLGWIGLTVLLGSFFDLPIKVTAAAGAILGPLGFVLIIFIGAGAKAGSQVRAGVSRVSAVTRPRSHSLVSEDPFT